MNMNGQHLSHSMEMYRLLQSTPEETLVPGHGFLQINLHDRFETFVLDEDPIDGDDDMRMLYVETRTFSRKFDKTLEEFGMPLTTRSFISDYLFTMRVPPVIINVVKEEIGAYVVKTANLARAQGLNSFGVVVDLDVTISIELVEEPTIIGGGSPRAVIDGLERNTYTGDDDTALARCIVCLEDFVVGCETTKMPAICRHIFHRDCLARWLEDKNSCPLCRCKVSD